MWQVEPTDQWEKDVKHYGKKHPRELAAILNNVIRYLSLLNNAPNAKAARIAGFLHPEPAGVIAVDQKGGGGNLQETRGYTYADEAEKVLYLITLGNKDSQPNDVKLGKQFVHDFFSPPQTN